MKKIFTLIASALLVGSMNLSAVDINVTPDDDLKAIIDEAAEGDVVILADGEYTTTGTTINLTKSVTLKALNSQSAVLYGYQFIVPAGGTIADLTFDGLVSGNDATVDSKYFLQINTATSFVTNLTLKDCKITGYGRGVIRGTTDNAKLDNLLIENCTFEENSIPGPGYAHINIQKINVLTATVRNSTFYNSKAAVFRYEGKTAINFLFENCTVINCGSAAGRTMMEVGTGVVDGSVFKVKNSIFTGSYDAEAPEKPINFRNKGDIENSLLEGFSTTLYKEATETNPVTGTVSSYDYSTFVMATTPTTITGIGDARWTLNGEGSTSIENEVADKNVVATEYFDLTGRKVTKDTEGVVILKNTFDDGSVSTSKTIK